MVVFCALMVVALLPMFGLLTVMGLELWLGERFALRSINGLFLLAQGSLITAAIVGVVLLRTMLRPLQELEARTAEIDAGRVDAFREMERGGTREVATLAQRFFALAQKLSDRSNYLTLFTTHVSHEFKTPLTSIQGAAELLRDQGDQMKPRQQKKFLNNILEDAERLTLLSTRLRELARAEMAEGDGNCEPMISLRQIADQEGLGISVDQSCKQFVAISAENLGIIWQQLVRNANENGATMFSVTCEQTDKTVIFHIGDDGAVLSNANRQSIFGAFFTTRRAEGGTGMGLSIARTMAQSHGGSLELAQISPWKFCLKLPLFDQV